MSFMSVPTYPSSAFAELTEFKASADGLAALQQLEREAQTLPAPLLEEIGVVRAVTHECFMLRLLLRNRRLRARCSAETIARLEHLLSRIDFSDYDALDAQ